MEQEIYDRKTEEIRPKYMSVILGTFPFQRIDAENIERAIEIAEEWEMISIDPRKNWPKSRAKENILGYLLQERLGEEAALERRDIKDAPIHPLFYFVEYQKNDPGMMELDFDGKSQIRCVRRSKLHFLMSIPLLLGRTPDGPSWIIKEEFHYSTAKRKSLGREIGKDLWPSYRTKKEN